MPVEDVEAMEAALGSQRNRGAKRLEAMGVRWDTDRSDGLDGRGGSGADRKDGSTIGVAEKYLRGSTEARWKTRCTSYSVIGSDASDERSM